MLCYVIHTHTHTHTHRRTDGPHWDSSVPYSHHIIPVVYSTPINWVYTEHRCFPKVSQWTSAKTQKSTNVTNLTRIVYFSSLQYLKGSATVRVAVGEWCTSFVRPSVCLSVCRPLDTKAEPLGNKTVPKIIINDTIRNYVLKLQSTLR